MVVVAGALPGSSGVSIDRRSQQPVVEARGNAVAVTAQVTLMVALGMSLAERIPLYRARMCGWSESHGAGHFGATL